MASDLALISGVFVSVCSEHYDYHRQRDGAHMVGDSHVLNVLLDGGECAAIEVRDGQAAEFLGQYEFGDAITAEIEYRARPASAQAQVTKSFRRVQRASNGQDAEAVKV